MFAQTEYTFVSVNIPMSQRPIENTRDKLGVARK
jgi:hypothetical protein